MAKKKRKKRDRGRKRGLSSFVAPVPGWVSSRIEELLEEERLEEALELLEEWLEKRPNHPSLLFYAGCVHMMMDHPWRALKNFREARRLDRRNESTLHNLIGLYLKLGFFTHGLRALGQYLKTETALEEGDTEELAEMRAPLQENQREAAAYFGVELELYNEGSYWDEEGKIAQQAGDWDGAIVAADKALGVLPEHPPVLNNRAMSYYYAGRLEEAVVDEERVAEMDPENVHALTNLTRFYYLRDELDKMRARFEQLQALPATAWEHQSDPIPKMLEAYAVAGTDEEIDRFLEQYKKELPARGWYMRGAVAANLGHRREARRAWKQVEEDGMGWKELAEEALQALEAGKPGLGRASRFPYLASYELLSQDQMDQLISALKEHREDEQKRQQTIAGMARQHPGLFEAVRWFLWHLEDAIPVIHMLALLGTEKAFAELRDFALGQAGSDDERMLAVQLLIQEGRLSLGQPLRLWLRGKWQETRLKMFEVTDQPQNLPYSEEVMTLLTRAGAAIQDEDWNRAEQIYQQVLEVDPRCCPAYNNLARITGERGDLKTSRAYLEKSLEIDPDYVVGRCNLAHHYLQDGEVERAEALIEPLVEREQFAAFEMKAYQLAQAHIRIQRRDLEVAENILGVLTEFYPDDPEVQELADRLGVLQPIGNLLKQVRENNQKKRERDDGRPLEAQASLEVCLHRHTKEALLCIARRLGLSGVSGGRKAALVEAVAAELRDAETLEWVVAQLPERPRAALDFVLEQGGTVSWEDFSERFGNDREESPYWQWSEPRSTMGLLRVCGLLFAGTEAGALRVLVPAELRLRLSGSSD